MPTIVHGGGITIVKSSTEPGAGVTEDGDDEVVSGVSTVTGEQSNLTLTELGRLRVDTAPTIEDRNLFAGPSAWSSKSPW